MSRKLNENASENVLGQLGAGQNDRSFSNDFLTEIETNTNPWSDNLPNFLHIQ
jgi:hypothetical protein